MKLFVSIVWLGSIAFANEPTIDLSGEYHCQSEKCFTTRPIELERKGSAYLLRGCKHYRGSDCINFSVLLADPDGDLVFDGELGTLNVTYRKADSRTPVLDCEYDFEARVAFEEDGKRFVIEHRAPKYLKRSLGRCPKVPLKNYRMRSFEKRSSN